MRLLCPHLHTPVREIQYILSHYQRFFVSFVSIMLQDGERSICYLVGMSCPGYVCIFQQRVSNCTCCDLGVKDGSCPTIFIKPVFLSQLPMTLNAVISICSPPAIIRYLSSPCVAVKFYCIDFAIANSG